MFTLLVDKIGDVIAVEQKQRTPVRGNDRWIPRHQRNSPATLRKSLGAENFPQHRTPSAKRNRHRSVIWMVLDVEKTPRYPWHRNFQLRRSTRCRRRWPIVGCMNSELDVERRQNPKRPKRTRATKMNARGESTKRTYQHPNIPESGQPRLFNRAWRFYVTLTLPPPAQSRSRSLEIDCRPIAGEPRRPANVQFLIGLAARSARHGAANRQISIAALHATGSDLEDPKLHRVPSPRALCMR